MGKGIPRIATVSLVGCLLAAPAVARGATRYAEPGGNGPAGSCPQANPCGIQVAVEDPSVNLGDEVVLLPGTYPLGGDTLTMSQIEVHGADGKPAPRLTSSAAPYAVQVGTGTLRRVVVDSTASGSYAAYTFGGQIEQVYAEATGANSRGCWLLAGALVQDSVCRSTAGGIGLSVQAGGVTTHTVAAHNVTAVATGLGATGIVVDSGFGSNMNLNARNVIASGPAGDAVATTDSAGGTATLTLVNSDYATQVETGTGATVTDPGIGNNITGTPLFADVDSGDFHERAGSPTINAGSNGGLDQFDIDGQARVQGGKPDIGADEFDQIAPGTSIDKKPAKRLHRRKASFSFTSTEAGSTFSCRRDGGKFNPCTSPTVLRGVRPGAHRFQVRATDPTGNVDPTPASFRFRVLARR